MNTILGRIHKYYLGQYYCYEFAVEGVPRTVRRGMDARAPGMGRDVQQALISFKLQSQEKFDLGKVCSSR